MLHALWTKSQVWQLQFLLVITWYTGISCYLVGVIYVHQWVIVHMVFTGVSCHPVDGSSVQHWILMRYFSLLNRWWLCTVIKTIWHDNYNDTNSYPFSKILFPYLCILFDFIFIYIFESLIPTFIFMQLPCNNNRYGIFILTIMKQYLTELLTGHIIWQET